MANNFRYRRDADDRSAGGKIMRIRRVPAASRTPYARPEPPSVQPAHASMNSENPNYWLSGLMLPARMIATGAGKIFSTVFGADSSSSSSSSDGDSVSESDGNGEDVDVVSHIYQPRKVASSSIEKSENKHLIQQLVMQEAFSSEEGEELIKLIKSRVVNDDGSLTNIEMTPDTQAAAIMEAKKWLKEKESASGLTPKLNDQIYGSNPAAFIEGELGSPVDVAKSYMQARPAWSSPSLKHVEFSTPSTSKRQSSKDEISKSIFPTPLQLSEAKRSSLLTGSWNILAEIRRVRSRATEELLATTPSEKVDLPTFPLEHKSSEDDPKTRNIDEVTGDQLHNSTSAVLKFDKNAPLHLADKNFDVFPESILVEPDRLHSETLPANGDSSTCNQYEDGEAVQVFEDAQGEAKPAYPDANSKQLDGCPLPNETNGSRDSAAENGFPHGALRLSVGDQNNPKSHDKEMINAINSGEGKVDRDNPAENMESENQPYSADIPCANENNSIVSGSQNSSSMQYEELSQDGTQSTPKRAGASKLRGRMQGKSRRGTRKR